MVSRIYIFDPRHSEIVKRYPTNCLLPFEVDQISQKTNVSYLILVPLFYDYFCIVEPIVYQCNNPEHSPLVLIFGEDGPQLPLNTPKCVLGKKMTFLGPYFQLWQPEFPFLTYGTQKFWRCILQTVCYHFKSMKYRRNAQKTNVSYLSHGSSWFQFQGIMNSSIPVDEEWHE